MVATVSPSLCTGLHRIAPDLHRTKSAKPGTQETAIPLAQALLKLTLLLPVKCHGGRPDYRSSPKFLRSSGPSLVATTPSPCTILRISSTTSGLARVVTSPIFIVLEIDARTRRIILPERVLGISGTMYTCLGLAIGPMMVSMA